MAKFQTKRHPPSSDDGGIQDYDFGSSPSGKGGGNIGGRDGSGSPKIKDAGNFERKSKTERA